MAKKMKTLSQIAEALGVQRATLAFRLWKDGIKPTAVEMIDGVATKMYDRDGERRIADYLKDHPVRAQKARA